MCPVSAKNNAKCTLAIDHEGPHSWRRPAYELVLERRPVPPDMTEEELTEYRLYVPRDNRQEED